jgi:hypothetical protein
VQVQIQKKEKSTFTESQVDRLSAKNPSAVPRVGRCSWECTCKFKKKTRKIGLHREPGGEALGEEPIFVESFALTEGYFHQILFKNSKQIQNFAKNLTCH